MPPPVLDGTLVPHGRALTRSLNSYKTSSQPHSIRSRYQRAWRALRLRIFLAGIATSPPIRALHLRRICPMPGGRRSYARRRTRTGGTPCLLHKYPRSARCVMLPTLLHPATDARLPRHHSERGQPPMHDTSRGTTASRSSSLARRGLRSGTYGHRARTASSRVTVQPVAAVSFPGLVSACSSRDVDTLSARVRPQRSAPHPSSDVTTVCARRARIFARPALWH
ncbi:hypothetical protein DFH09DRAFT_1127904 [Mycena vulgaris]|nr:hypothetical protein DFH09DRAFT_1127904 [Mycena vulgaris]